MLLLPLHCFGFVFLMMIQKYTAHVYVCTYVHMDYRAHIYSLHSVSQIQLFSLLDFNTHIVLDSRCFHIELSHVVCVLVCFLNATTTTTKKMKTNEWTSKRTKQKSNHNTGIEFTCVRHCHVRYFVWLFAFAIRNKPFHFDVVQSTRIYFLVKTF